MLFSYTVYHADVYKNTGPVGKKNLAYWWYESLSSTANTVTAYTGCYNQKASTTALTFSPAVRYFFTRKFAAGVKPAFSYYKTKKIHPGEPERICVGFIYS